MTNQLFVLLGMTIKRGWTSSPASLDAFAAASPFGAAMLAGAEVFGAVITEANPALAAMTGGKAAAGMTFGDLIDPASRIDAGFGAGEGRAQGLRVREMHAAQREEPQRGAPAASRNRYLPLASLALSSERYGKRPPLLGIGLLHAPTGTSQRARRIVIDSMRLWM